MHIPLAVSEAADRDDGATAGASAGSAGTTPLSPSGLALGCARLGSALTPLDREGCVALVEQAFALGVRHFDTAATYGQGDSERFIGQALHGRRAQVCLASKAGQRLTPAQALMSGLKAPIRWLASRHEGLRAGVLKARSGGLPRCFEPDFIERSLHDSLERLRTDHLDIFYLHGPDAAALRNGKLLARIERMRAQGLFRAFGVSCDDAAVAWSAARLDTVQVVQFALDPASGADALLHTLARRGKRAVLRGVMHAGAPATPEALALRFGRTLRLPAFGGLIVGTTRPEHLRENVLAFREASATGAAAPDRAAGGA